jgi:hypothetical protein
MKEELKILGRNRDYILTVIAVSLSAIFFFVFSTTVGQLMLPFGLDDDKYTST